MLRNNLAQMSDQRVAQECTHAYIRLLKSARLRVSLHNPRPFSTAPHRTRLTLSLAPRRSAT
jgi:hypothetical protein